MSDGRDKPEAQAPWVGALTLVALAVVAYAPSFAVPFIWDDLPHIVGHPAFVANGGLRAWIFGGTQETRPLLNASFWLCATLFGRDPAGWHAFNLAMHLLAVLAFWRLAVAMRARNHSHGANDDSRSWWRDGAFWAAAIFAVHPLATEAVTYVNSRSVVMASAAMWASFWLLERARLRTPGRTYRINGGSTLAMSVLACGLLAKEMAVTLPLLVLLCDALLPPRDASGLALPWRQRWRGAALLTPALLLVPLLFATLQSPHTQHIGFDILDPWRHLWTQPIALVRLLGLIVVPFGQNLDHDLPLANGPLDPHTLLALAGLGFGLFASWRLRRSAPLAALPLVAYLIVMAPTNSIVPFYDYMCERHVYPGIAVVAIGGGLLLDRLLRPASIRAGQPANFAAARMAGTVALVVALAALTVVRNQLWQDPVALWREAALLSPDKARPAAQLGAHLARKQALVEARPWLERAVRQAPDVHVWRANLGLLYRLSGDGDAEVALWQQRVDAQPQDSAAKTALRRLQMHQVKARRALQRAAPVQR